MSHGFLYSSCSSLSSSCLCELGKSVRCSSIHSTLVSAKIEGEKGVRFLRQGKETEGKRRAGSDLQRRLLISTQWVLTSLLWETEEPDKGQTIYKDVVMGCGTRK